MLRPHTFKIAITLLGLTCLACSVPVPQPPRLTIAIDAKGRVQVPPPPVAEVEIRPAVEAPEGVSAEVEVEVEAEGGIEAYPEAPIEPAPVAPVALEGSGIVEFFGIPLEGAQDVVFVLDRSGSMDELARGQIAQLDYQQALPGEPPAGPPQPELQVPPSDDAQTPPPAPESVPPQPPGPPPSLEEAPLPQEAPPQLQGPRKIDIAHSELVDALSRLPAGTRMNLLFFNDRLEALQATIVPLHEGDRDSVLGFVRETFPYGPTALAPAMRAAFLMNAKRIVLLSDGLGNVGGDAESVMRDAREAMRGGVRIDTIGLGQDQNAWLLQRLARESGGIYQPL